MATSGVIYNILHALNLPVDIRNVCVLLAPGFSALTAWATYMYALLTASLPIRVTDNHTKAHERNEGRERWFVGCSFHWHCSRLHIAFRRWLVRQ